MRAARTIRESSERSRRPLGILVRGAMTIRITSERSGGY